MNQQEYREMLHEVALEIRRGWERFFLESLYELGVATPVSQVGSGERSEVYGEFQRELARRGIRLCQRDRFHYADGLMRVVCEVWYKGTLFRTTEEDYDPFMEKYGERKPMLKAWLKEK